MAIADRLQEARLSAGLRLGQAVRLLGNQAVTRADLESWESGHTQPPSPVLDLLGDLYSVRTEWLGTGVERTPTPKEVRGIEKLQPEDAAKVLHALRIRRIT